MKKASRALFLVAAALCAIVLGRVASKGLRSGFPEAYAGESRAPAVSAASVEYRAGNGSVASRVPAPVCDKWPDIGWWLSANSMKRHNSGCENYRKTRGYPCKKNEGSPCVKCGG